jgi:hypothetical protein
MKVEESAASRVFANDYRAERRHRDGSRTTGLQFWACHSITAEAMAKAPSKLRLDVRYVPILL